MAIPDRVREIEREIDGRIRRLPIWKSSRDAVVGVLMGAYSDAIQMTYALAMHARFIGKDSTDFFARESQMRGGAFWALKWASEYCPATGPSATIKPKKLVDLVLLGATYEAFVDALKLANRDLVTVEILERSNTITFYEGGPGTEFDGAIVEHQRSTTPAVPHVSLTQDEDQLTSRWKAGDYRRAVRRLADFAIQQEKILCVDPDLLKKLRKPEISVPQPTLVWLGRPDIIPDSHVFDDLVLPAVDDVSKWRLVSFMDRPIVRVGDRFCALSCDLKTIAAIDDYMSRLAAQVDPDQYSRATTSREDRMIGLCRAAFERAVPPWSVTTRVLLKSPPQEIDVLARRDGKSIVLQLKSTLRPETPWEVFKRNEGLIAGVRHTREVLDRGAAEQGFVVTDGYRGDYACWKEALTSGIPIGTLYDLEDMAMDPITAATKLKSRVGITGSSQSSREGVKDRENNIMGWTIRLKDEKAPSRSL